MLLTDCLVTRTGLCRGLIASLNIFVLVFVGLRPAPAHLANPYYKLQDANEPVTPGLMVGPELQATPTPSPTSPPDDGGVVSVDPVSRSIAVGETAAVDIDIADVFKLFGADVRITFNPAVVRVVDAQDTVRGVQIEPGPFPDLAGEGFIVRNEADNLSGMAIYAGTLLRPATPVSGSGSLARIVFQCVTAGTSPVRLESVTWADASANPIPGTVQNGLVTCVVKPAFTPTLTPTRQPMPRPVGGHGVPMSKTKLLLPVLSLGALLALTVVTYLVGGPKATKLR